MPTQKPCWTSYFVIGTLAVMSSWVAMFLSGCRFGNKIEQAPDPDQVTGYYETVPQRVRYCAYAVQTTCQDLTPNLVPADIRAVMSNPVILALQDVDTGYAVLAHYINQQYRLKTYAKDGKIAFIGMTDPETLWLDEACQTQLSLEENGSYTRFSEVVQSATAGVRLSGKVAINIVLARVFEGKCEDSLKKMADCHSDPALCEGSSTEENAQLQKVVQSVFNEHIKAGVMTTADIPTLKGISYEVEYR